MLNVYGADFSGAMNPKIFYVHGELEGSHLSLKSIVTCDDRLDLYHAIVRSGWSLWGLDFPFAIPMGAMQKFGFVDWLDTLQSTAKMTRKQFAAFIAAELDDYPRKCTAYDRYYCRFTDAAVQAYSVFKTVNPNLRVMLYSGLRMLLYLSLVGVNIYPFSYVDLSSPNVYEVYPSYAWQAVGLKRSLNIREFLARFNDLDLIQVESELDVADIINQDMADSIAACVMMATAYVTQEMKQGWDYRLPIFTDEEWEWRDLEGLIVRF